LRIPDHQRDSPIGGSRAGAKHRTQQAGQDKESAKDSCAHTHVPDRVPDWSQHGQSWFKPIEIGYALAVGAVGPLEIALRSGARTVTRRSSLPGRK
jgi:hypothetical protein